MKATNILFTARKPEQSALLLSIHIVFEHKMHRKAVPFHKVQFHRRITDQVIKTVQGKTPHGDHYGFNQLLISARSENAVRNKTLFGKCPQKLIQIPGTSGRVHNHLGLSSGFVEKFNHTAEKVSLLAGRRFNEID